MTLNAKALEAAKVNLRHTLRRQCAVVATHGLFEGGVALKVREVLAAGLHLMRYWEGEKMVLPKKLPNDVRDELLQTSDHLIDFIAEHAITAYQQASGTGWQPIETADKDNEEPIILRAGGRAYAPCIWSKAGEISEDGFWLWWQSEPTLLAEVKEPTHWMSLPSPPGETG